MVPQRAQGLQMAVRFGVAVIVAVLVPLIVPLPDALGPVARLLVGFVAGALVLDVPLLWMIVRMEAPETARYVRHVAPTKGFVDAVVIVAAVASLGAIAFMMLGGGDKDQQQKDLEAALTIAAVACAWLSIHTIYTLRYARHYYVSEPRSVDFNTDDDPRMSDFAYFAFTLGMTYQVADTNIATPRLRRIVLGHTLLSYVFGTVIIAATINLVVGLAQ